MVENLSVALTDEGRTDEAAGLLRQAVALNPDSPTALITLASLLTSCLPPSVDDAQLAVQLAERAAMLTEHSAPDVLDVLAAAYAAAGRFGEAESMAQSALRMSEAAGDRERVIALRERLARYQRNER